MLVGQSFGGRGVPDLNEKILAAIVAQGSALDTLARSSEHQTRSLGQMNEGLTLLLERQSADRKHDVNLGTIKGAAHGGVSLANTIGMLAAVAAIGGVMLSGINSTVGNMSERMESDNRREMTDAYNDGRRDERLDTLESDAHTRATHLRDRIEGAHDG